MLKRITAVGALCVLLAACGGAEELQPPVRISKPIPGRTSQDLRVLLTMEVTGAARVSLKDKRALIHFEEIVGSTVPRLTWFFSASTALQEEIRLPDGRQLVFTADLAPGSYEGPGTYQLSGRGTKAVGSTEGLGGASYVHVFRLEEPIVDQRFDELLEPCTVTMTDRFASGSVRCPKLGGKGDTTVAAAWSWKRI